MVVFTEKDHQYFETERKAKYMSVSGLFKKFQKPFDAEFQATRSAIAILAEDEYMEYKKLHGWDDPDIVNNLMKYVDPLELELVKNCFLQQWREKGEYSSERGTNMHTVLENLSYEIGGRINPRTGKRQKTIVVEKEYDNQAICENLYDLEDGYYPELLVFDHDNFLAGQVDGGFVSTFRGRKIVDIIDYKSDQKIYKQPKFFDRRNKTYPKLKSPLNHLTDCNFNIYSVKTSVYAYMLEKFGYQVGTITIIHLDHDSNDNYLGQVTYPVQYRKMEVELMLEQINPSSKSIC